MAGNLEQDYRGAGFAGQIGFGSRPALIVIDMMMNYFDRTSPMYARVEDVAESSARLAELAIQKNVPIIFTKQFYDQDQEDSVYVRKVPALKMLRRDSPLTNLHPAMPTRNGKVLVKKYPSAFYKTDLAMQLRALGVDTLIIAGLTTSGCVRATAMDTLLHDLAGIVVREAVGDRDDRAHEANLFDINAKLADVRSEREVTEWINSACTGR
jgi:maleamate amidohydrolase